MPGQNYDRLEVVEFGRQLITSGDLDPVYIALVRANLPQHQKMRWLVAYWCLYHAGVASWLSERKGEDFWVALMTAAANLPDEPAPIDPPKSRWPRGKERRHWRGEQATNSAFELAQRYREAPEEFVQYIMGGKRITRTVPFGTIVKRVKEHRGFGAWIAFKIADMLERCLKLPVNFDTKDVFLYRDPYKAAIMVWQRWNDCIEQPDKPDEAIEFVVNQLIKKYSDLQAPPLGDRPIGIQEVETVLCKWKSHVKGFYPLNNDIIEIRCGLLPWLAHSEAARAFERAMPKVEA